MSYYVGIDAGGSKTYALVCDHTGRIVGKGSAGGGNHQNGYEEARSNLSISLQQALYEAGITAADVEHACFGLAGADREADFRILHPLVNSLGFTERYTIVCDTIIGLRAGTRRPYGVSVICGTGVNCAGVDPDGRTYQCGGFSYMYGDWGGGGGLCVEVFRAVVRSWDGRGAATQLTPMLLGLLGYSTVDKMFHDYLDHNRSVPLDAVRLLFQAAGNGDDVALGILREQGKELALSVHAVVAKLGLGGIPFDVVLAGSLLTRGDAGWISGPIQAMLKDAAPLASLVKLEIEPVIGALWGALDACGQEITGEMYAAMGRYRNFEDIQTSSGQS
ncbi:MULTISPECIES: BadF/BadG/BcrA/BcrD ATPase family protein [unclassified Paenibacillus]|uniref:N-acetylglucosamine kinase n=1 Tax=unclassified Paenibacillus TaxID=185978 RepID=UPI000953CB07|nr:MULTISPECIES: BadF/BadG/BcrA/BcrD ATPase family protein [unclassified Paenibacillus]ASS64896.1 ATPase [Paenibacillus sp. RUD330]SIR02269.1 BadF-type ATPase [Paenibacillus sp. RU4X]SIR32815.1 BadF-type ATPase [Paenibacillus sp. RU4T]